jgi:hypothetical protein
MLRDIEECFLDGCILEVASGQVSTWCSSTVVFMVWCGYGYEDPSRISYGFLELLNHMDTVGPAFLKIVTDDVMSGGSHHFSAR